MRARALAFTAVVAAIAGAAVCVALAFERSPAERAPLERGRGEAQPTAEPAETRERDEKRARDRAAPSAPRRPRMPAVDYRDSTALGTHEAGSLSDGVRLPHEGRDHFTWDPILKQRPNRTWRRWGTDDLVRTTLRIARDHARANPGAPRMGVGDLSLPEGGDFGAEVSGGIGHASHQNGLDIDVYYPLRSRAERAPLTVDEVDLDLAQDLVDRFVAAGAIKVFVGPNTPLTGPPDIVAPLVHHDNHLHARFAP